MALGLAKRIYTTLNPNEPVKSSDALKFGILGAAQIGPMALISPAKSHPEVIVYGVAARNAQKAKDYAKKNGIEKTYGSYQELLDDPVIDVVYNPLPNGLHYEWTMKALKAGKHVLLEKPAADTAEETQIMFDYAKERGLVLLEAFHYRFHPAIQRVKAIVQSGEIGPIKTITAKMLMPTGIFKPDDIRLNYDLGGGGLMDMGCYTMNLLRYLSSSNPTSVVSSSVTPYVPPSQSSTSSKPNIDRGTTATLAFPKDILGTLSIDLAMPNKCGVIPKMPTLSAKVEGENGEVEITNFIMPVFWHSISVTVKNPETNKVTKRVEKAYTFKEAGIPIESTEGAAGRDVGGSPDWWSTYRYQLEAFVDRVKGRKPQTWVEPEDSVANMEWIEKVYESIGMDSRPKSTFKISEST